MTIRVLLYGGAGVGKNALAEEIATLTQCEVVAIADPIKAFLKVVFDWPEPLLWGPSENRGVFPVEWERFPDENWERAEQKLVETLVAMGRQITQDDNERFWMAFDQIKAECTSKVYDPYLGKVSLDVTTPLTARKLCKTFGQVGRQISPYFWVKHVPAPGSVVPGTEFQFVTDIRFPNEIAYLKANSPKTITVSVADPENPSTDLDITERSMDSYDGWDIWLSNPKDNNLRSRAQQLLATLRTFK